MALISKIDLRVKKLVILIQEMADKDQTQQTSLKAVENKGMITTLRINLSVLTNTGLTQMSQQETDEIKRSQTSPLMGNIMDSAQGVVEDKTTSQIQMNPLAVAMSLVQASPIHR